MTVPSGAARADSAGPFAGHRASRLFVLPVVTVVAAAAAMLVLAARADEEVLDYGVGLVPAVVPWLSALLGIAVAAVGASGRRVPSATGALLMGSLGLVTAWSVAMLPFDVLRIVRLIPLPVSGWGFGLRILLLVGGIAAIVPPLVARRAGQARCSSCRRVLPGKLDAVPLWPAVVAVLFALPYPVLRTVWALGGTFATMGQPLDLESAVAWGAAIAGMALVAVTLLLAFGKGPGWARALFGLGGVALGLALAVDGGLAAAGAAAMIMTLGAGASAGAGLPAWTFLLVYGSWFVTGLGVIAGGWRYWAHRREDCAACRTLLAPGKTRHAP